MKIGAHIMTLLLGLFLVAYSFAISTRPIAVWSDFKAFQARVATDEQAAHALNYGGENDTDNFDALLAKIWAMKNGWRPVGLVGLLLIVIPIIQINADRKK